MKKVFYFVLILSAFAACENQHPKEENHQSSQDAEFDTYKTELIEELWKLNPVWASYEGKHDYDEQLSIPDEARKEEERNFWNKVEQQLDSFDIVRLSPNNQIDYHLIKDRIASSVFYRETFQSGKWNPSSYNLGGAFFQVLNYRAHSLEERLNDVLLKLNKVPAYYQAAKMNLERTTEVHAQLAIQQINGSLSIFKNTLTDSLEAAGLDEAFNTQFASAQNEAVKAIEDYLNFLEKEFIPAHKDRYKDFRIGKELFEQKFKHDIQSGFSAEEVYQFAMEEKQKLHEKMAKTAENLWPKYFEDEQPPSDPLELISKVITEVSKVHTHRDSFVVTIRKQIPELESFVQNKGLITLDPNKPLTVRETPEYMRGFAGASISAPGPYDAEAETYYNVTPLDHYTEEQAESYLREYNQYTLQILNIHEAVPGHYTQLVYSNQSPSIVKSIFGNGAMIEGWAVYSELMMIENGYSEGQPEMDLMYYKWNLRTVCNTILDYGLHVLNMSEEEAMDLLVNQAFQEQSEAEGKWRRARLSQVQLCSYFTGYYEIRALREEIKTKLGDQFDLKQFHERFLSYGSSPVKYIRELMLKDMED